MVLRVAKMSPPEVMVPHLTLDVFANSVLAWSRRSSLEMEVIRQSLIVASIARTLRSSRLASGYASGHAYCFRLQ